VAGNLTQKFDLLPEFYSFGCDSHFQRRSKCAVIGTVPNHATRLCEEAKSRQILVSQRVLGIVEPLVESIAVGALTLKGFHRRMQAYEIVRWLG
jgi:class 3 adenylate cyclase